MDILLAIKFLSVFVFVISLMFLLSWGLKRLGVGGASLSGDKKRRLKVMEYLQVDATRRLVLIKCDDKEHLVMLGKNSETVIETGIPSATEEEHETVVKFARDQRNVKI